MELAQPTHCEGCSECIIENGYIIDPVTFDYFPASRLVMVRVGNGRYCFDIKSLYKITKRQRIPLNPFTNTPLDSETLKRLREYREIRKQRFRENRRKR